MADQPRMVRVVVLDGSRDEVNGHHFDYWHPWPYPPNSEEGYDEVEREVDRWKAFLGHEDFMLQFQVDDAA